MKTDVQKLSETRYLCQLYEQVKQCSNKISAMYMSTILGMWSHVYGVSSKQNPFSSQGDTDLIRELARSWSSGWNASFKSLEFKIK